MTQTQRLMLRGLALLSVVTVLCGAVGGFFSPAGADLGSALYTGTAGISPLNDLRRSLAMAVGESEIRSLQLSRANTIMELSSRYRVPADLSALIHDEAVRAGLDPELAFRLVRVESNFNPQARSVANAIGLAQVQLATARHYDRHITEKDLYDPQRNLQIGFRYLRDLHDRYRNNMRMALLAYNVGPGRLQEILDGGRTPTGTYASAVLKGYPAGPQVDLPADPAANPPAFR
ncbi:MAG: transglycosylase SLT domain-containing protein [Gemmatimonadetes bacterium]|nr:transglycosylase SLT domain-containing protein [Gemmatimonadota bacterium]